MKYIRRFNEELKSSTYRSASRKLAKLGHIKRSGDLKDWATEVERVEGIEKWKSNIEELKKFGKFSLTVVNPETLYSVECDFYLQIMIDKISLEDNLDNIINGEVGYLWMPVGAIPVDEKNLNKYIELMPDSDMIGNGFFWSFTIIIEFKIENDVIKIDKFFIEQYDSSEYGEFKISDRASANRLKRLLKHMFSKPDLGYPSSYTDHENFYDVIDYGISAGLGLSEYGFKPEIISEFIDGLNLNHLYKN